MATWRRTKLTIDDMRRIAELRGGRCLSEEYRGNKVKLRWRCQEGHEWETRPEYVRRGHWCPTCAAKNRHQHDIEEIRRLAAEFGGKCISETYENYRTPLNWECAHGHHFSAPFWWVKGGRWCPVCSGKPNGFAPMTRLEPAPSLRQSEPGLTRAREVAVGRGGKCLSTEYAGNDSLMLWQCARGHRWQARYKNIVAGTWCPACAVIRRIEAQKAQLGVVDIRDLDGLQAFAESRGLELLQNGPVRVGRQDFFRCETGHMWELHRSYVSAVVWCPACGKRGEPLGLGRIVR